MQPRLIKTYLPDGTLEGVRVIELSESDIKGVVVPRLKLSDTKRRPELQQPALYLLINSGDNQLYIGESENFYYRIKTHDQSKSFWDVAVAIVSNTNTLEKSDVKYLESLAVERAKATSASGVLNKTVPIRNNVHEFKVHTLEKVLEDANLILESLGYSVFASTQEGKDEVWYCKSKKTDARAQFRGDIFAVLAGSIIDTSFALSWEHDWPQAQAERLDLFSRFSEVGPIEGTVVMKDNVAFKSPNHAGGFVTGRSVNAWTTWKDKNGRTMDEVMRRDQK